MRVHPELWQSRPWNTPAGRVCQWIKQYRRTGSYVARQALTWAYLTSLDRVGRFETYLAVKQAGLTLPSWLTASAAPAAPAAIEHHSIEQKAA